MKIKLKPLNKIKYCPVCKINVEIEMDGLDGYCPNCQNPKIKLFSMSNKR